MQIPKTTHKKVKYRNGEFGSLLTTERTETVFSVLTLREKPCSVMHHLAGGENRITKEESPYDIIEVEQ